MYSVLVVDDEEWIRKGLVSKIHKSGLDFVDVRQAADAEQALQLISEHVPDILICDIRMADMDGLQLIQIVHYKHPQIKTVILSGYAEFEYAAEALKQEVVEYLLKPIDQTSLDRALEKCIKGIEKNRTEQHQTEELKRLSIVNQIRLNVQHVLRKEGNPNEVFPDYRKDDHFQAICLFVEISLDPVNIMILHQLISQDPIWNFQKNIVYFEQKEREFFFITSSSEAVGADHYYTQQVEYLIAKVTQEMKRRGSHRFTFGISDAHLDMDACVNQALTCMKHRIFLEERLVIFPEDIKHFQSAYKLSPDAVLHLQRAIEARSIKDLAQYFNWLNNEVVLASASYRSIQNVYNRLLMLATETTGEGKIEQYINLLPVDIYLYPSLRQMFEAVRGLFITIINASTPMKPTKETVIQAIKTYIDERYTEDIRLEQLSVQKGYNASYLSFLFKEVTGENFQDYLLKVRIENAKRLMLEGKIKVKDIAYVVGFNDHHYFSQAFKKLVGVRPTEFIKNNVDPK